MVSTKSSSTWSRYAWCVSANFWASADPGGGAGVPAGLATVSHEEFATSAWLETEAPRTPGSARRRSSARSKKALDLAES